MKKDSKPLVIDLDGTLIKSDLLYESLFKFLKHNIFHFLLVILWTLKGRAYLKARISEKVDINVSSLPYNLELLEYIHSQKEKRKLVLASASNSKFVKDVFDDLNLFDDYIASDINKNMSGFEKAKRLRELLGDDNYIYAGNSKDDMPIWKSCKEAIAVDLKNKYLEKLRNSSVNIVEEFNSKKPSLFDWIGCLRVHQWVKNILIFVPLLLSQKYIYINSQVESLLGFIVFSICASSVYLLNDLFDIEDDRNHRSKKNRAIPSGIIQISSIMAVFPILLILAFFISFIFLPVEFTLLLIGYFLLTFLYSLYLKQKVLLDVIILASLYTLRVVAGTVVIGEMISFWLLTFSIFFFLSLAITKRFTELMSFKMTNTKVPKGRGYYVSDMVLLSSLGTASGFMSVLVLALFINSNEFSQKYSSPDLLWLLMPLMIYWVSRFWIIAHRGEMHDDPIVFALKDRVSRYLCFMIIGIVLGAIWI